jgi:glutamate/tyrosine decarboxylase-like PLP-dependent enzyme
VNRVTSISIDTHKYGYADKGTSIILYRNHNDFRKHQIFVDSKWQGGIYATPTLPGSRSGKDIAGTWAALIYTGTERYKTLARSIVKLTKSVSDVIRRNPHLKIIGEGNVMVVGFGSIDDRINIYDVKSEMTKKGWYLSSLQNPESVHLCITAVHAENDNFLQMFTDDLEDCIHIVKLYIEDKRSKSGDAIMYKSNHTLGKKEFIGDLAKYYWDVCGKTKPTLPNQPSRTNPPEPTQPTQTIQINPPKSTLPNQPNPLP